MQSDISLKHIDLFTKRKQSTKIRAFETDLNDSLDQEITKEDYTKN